MRTVVLSLSTQGFPPIARRHFSFLSQSSLYRADPAPLQSSNVESHTTTRYLEGTMHVFRTSALLFAASLCAASVNLAGAQPNAPSKLPEFLFVQSAKNVAFRVLTLQDVSPVTAFFSERPNRMVGQIRNDLFLKQWTDGKNSFKNDPPNAFLTVFNERTRPMGATVVLTNPRLVGNNLLYDAQILKGAPPAAGIESTLFIDGGGAPCDPQFDTGDPGYPCWAQQAFSAAQGG